MRMLWFEPNMHQWYGESNRFKTQIAMFLLCLQSQRGPAIPSVRAHLALPSLLENLTTYQTSFASHCNLD